MILKTVLYVFFGIAFSDVLWAIYFIAVSKNKKLVAGIASGSIIYISSGVVIDYVNDIKLRYFAAAGAIFGTWIALKINEYYESKIKHKFIG